MLSPTHELRQVGALPMCVNAAGGIDVFLVTARGSGRWIIPKGNLIRGLSPHEAAAQEAREEAGLVGRIERRCIGTFEFSRHRSGRAMTCFVDVYALEVERQLRKWAEADQRSILQCNVGKALSLICSPSLATLIQRYVFSARQYADGDA